MGLRWGGANRQPWRRGKRKRREEVAFSTWERTRWRENKMKRKENKNIKVLEHLREFPKFLLNPCFLAR
jgi:hypothetical protein